MLLEIALETRHFCVNIIYPLPVNLYHAWSISSVQIPRTHQVSCADHGYGHGVVCLSVYIGCMSPTVWSAIAVTFFSMQLQSCVYRDVGGVDDDRNDAIRAGSMCVCEAIGYKCAGERWSFDAGTASARGFYTRGPYGAVGRRFPRFEAATTTAVTSRRWDNFGMHDRQRYSWYTTPPRPAGPGSYTMLCFHSKGA